MERKKAEEEKKKVEEEKKKVEEKKRLEEETQRKEKEAEENPAYDDWRVARQNLLVSVNSSFIIPYLLVICRV